MKNKKGFTLIELLAVIVILAIIALIATPIVLNMINSARKNAAKSSALGFIDSIEYNNGFAQTEQAGYTEITGENLDVTSPTFSGLKLKGKKPTSGTITITNGKVENASLCVEGYTVTYVKNEVTDVDKGCGSSSSSSSEPASSGPTKEAAGANDTHKGIVYMDPTNLSATCNASNSVSTTGTKTGCMKFYIFDDSGDTYKMILDHNTTATVAYNTTRPYVEYAQASIKTTVDNDTSGWVGSPRLITANEIAAITENTTFDGSSSKWFYFGSNSTTGYSSQTEEQKARQQSYAWLFDYTNGCTSYGCDTADSSTKGYWTSSPVSDISYYAWYVHAYGSLYCFYVDNDGEFGVRPVITLSKTALSS